MLVSIRSAVPVGASLGTSAAVLVALLAALDAAVLGGERGPAELAAWAHAVETGPAGRESGVQDHWAAAFGGVSLLEVDYPAVERSAVDVPAATGAELAEDLVTVVFDAHDSAVVHRQVIEATRAGDPAARSAAARAFAELRRGATDAAEALAAGDLRRWAEVLVAATAVQAALHPELVGPAHREAIEQARSQGAQGWKVNGAGGTGGSLTVYAPGAAERLADAYRRVRGWTVLELTPSPGVIVR